MTPDHKWRHRVRRPSPAHIEAEVKSIFAELEGAALDADIVYREDGNGKHNYGLKDHDGYHKDRKVADILIELFIQSGAADVNDFIHRLGLTHRVSPGQMEGLLTGGASPDETLAEYLADRIPKELTGRKIFLNRARKELGKREHAAPEIVALDPAFLKQDRAFQAKLRVVRGDDDTTPPAPNFATALDDYIADGGTPVGEKSFGGFLRFLKGQWAIRFSYGEHGLQRVLGLAEVTLLNYVNNDISPLESTLDKLAEEFCLTSRHRRSLSLLAGHKLHRMPEIDRMMAGFGELLDEYADDPSANATKSFGGLLEHLKKAWGIDATHGKHGLGARLSLPDTNVAGYLHDGEVPEESTLDRLQKKFALAGPQRRKLSLLAHDALDFDLEAIVSAAQKDLAEGKKPHDRIITEVIREILATSHLTRHHLAEKAGVKLKSDCKHQFTHVESAWRFAGEVEPHDEKLRRDLAMVCLGRPRYMTGLEIYLALKNETMTPFDAMRQVRMQYGKSRQEFLDELNRCAGDAGRKISLNLLADWKTVRVIDPKHAKAWVKLAGIPESCAEEAVELFMSVNHRVTARLMSQAERGEISRAEALRGIRESQKRYVTNDVSVFFDARGGGVSLYQRFEESGFIDGPFLKQAREALHIPTGLERRFDRLFDGGRCRDVATARDWPGYYRAQRTFLGLTEEDIAHHIEEKTDSAPPVSGFRRHAPEDAALQALGELFAERSAALKLPFDQHRFLHMAERDRLLRHPPRMENISLSLEERSDPYQKYLLRSASRARKDMLRAEETVPPGQVWEHKERIAGELMQAMLQASGRSYSDIARSIGVGHEGIAGYGRGEKHPLHSIRRDCARAALNLTGALTENDGLAYQVALLLLGVPEARASEDMLNLMRAGSVRFMAGDVVREFRIREGFSTGEVLPPNAFAASVDYADERRGHVSGATITRLEAGVPCTNEKLARAVARRIGLRRPEDVRDFADALMGRDISRPEEKSRMHR